jgi:hypothetical protein
MGAGAVRKNSPPVNQTRIMQISSWQSRNNSDAMISKRIESRKKGEDKTICHPAKTGETVRFKFIFSFLKSLSGSLDGDQLF